MTEQTNSAGPVVAGPAGHWYALLEDPQFGQSLLGKPIPAGAEPGYLPRHPSEDLTGWLEITDPAPGVDVDAITADLERRAFTAADFIIDPPAGLQHP